MKNVKRTLAFTLSLLLMLSLSASAFAAQYSFTEDFVRDINETTGFDCSVRDIWTDSSGNKYEPVDLVYTGGEFSAYKTRLTVLFCEDGSEVTLNLFNLINFDGSRTDDVIDAVNDYNASSTGVKLFVDLSDNSVTAEMYTLATPETATGIAETAVGFIIAFTDAAYEALRDFNI